jgi:hypothetical protein
VIGIEADMRHASESLRMLAEDAWEDFVGTLRFEAGAHYRVALFRYAENIPALRGLPGLRVLTNGAAILVPPSRLGREIEIVYADSFAAPSDPPHWLLEPMTFVARFANT